jgi:hypothetical protein
VFIYFYFRQKNVGNKEYINGSYYFRVAIEFLAEIKGELNVKE